MSHGEIVETGTHHELLKNKEGNYAKLVHAQRFEQGADMVRRFSLKYPLKQKLLRKSHLGLARKRAAPFRR